jgi:hypothetical protein
MRYTILLDKNENTKEVEAQEQSRFLKTIIESLDLPIAFDPDETLTVDSKIELRKSFDKYSINVINDLDGGLQIFVGQDLVGEWKKCKYKLKQDLTKPDPNKRLYFEMQVDFWNAFETE